jgi:tetratricopeptide (TPR) repeat protein
MRAVSVQVEGRNEHIAAAIRFAGEANSAQAEVEFTFSWSDQDQEDLRWYLEDYLTYPVEPAPAIASRIEERLQAAGDRLFSGLFGGSHASSEIWKAAWSDASNLRFEIRTDNPRLAALPWELMRDPESHSVVSLSSRSFVRVHARPSRRAIIPPAVDGPIRMLLVICRPAGSDDVPFRSVASRILQGLGGVFGDAFALDVLRPPTFGQLSKVLRQAALSGKPYQIVHFDGHGLPGGLVFENSSDPANKQIVPGEDAGRLLADCGVPVLVLNACRSAFSDPQAQPVSAEKVQPGSLRVFNSVAHAVADQGLPCVLAMKFNVFVETAARCMFNFYSGLLEGRALGDAATAARAQLKAEPWRDAVPHAIRLEDWMVPVIFEAEPMTVRTTAPVPVAKNISSQAGVEIDLPRRPDVGVFGRDETLLAIDRAFDSDRVVLLHAFAGGGKTTVSVEFARWYLRTGGVRDGALFTSFDSKRTLGQVLQQLGNALEALLEQSGVIWGAIPDVARQRKALLDIIPRTSLLWIWDNVEPIAGFPSGTASDWTAEQQAELAGFLHDASDRGMKFLLTSRRDESDWLGLLPARLTMPPMPFWECLQLAQALTRKLGRNPHDVQDWKPLVDFARGNPLAVTVLVTQALRKRLRYREEISQFVSQLESGAAQFQDDASQGRTRSLTASLSYGLANAFTPEARKIVSLLHFFQGLVNVKVFALLGEGIHAIPEIVGLTSENLESIFNTASEIGLLEPVNAGIYRIHPVVPWFLKRDFDAFFAGRETACKRAFCVSVGMAGIQLSQQFFASKQGADIALLLEESNLRYALKLSLELEFWLGVMTLMHGLEDVYTTLRRNPAEWQRIVHEVTAIVTDPASDRSKPGREFGWRAVTEYRMRMARAANRYDEAQRLAELLVAYHREMAEPHLAATSNPREGREEIHNLSTALESLGTYMAHQHSDNCLPPIVEALQLAIKVDDRRQAASCAQSIGWVYREVPQLCDYDQSLAFFMRAYELVPDDDAALLGKILVLIGSVFVAKGDLAADRQSSAELYAQAGGVYVRALEILPDYVLESKAEASINLGSLLLKANALKEAEPHLRKGIEWARTSDAIAFEAAGLVNLASLFLAAGRHEHTIEFAKAARNVAARMGERGQDIEIMALQLLTQLKTAQRANAKP